MHSPQQVAAFFTSLYGKKIRKFVAMKKAYSYKLPGDTNRTELKAYLDEFFKDPTNQVLKRFITQTSYYDNGNYTALINKLHGL